MYLEGYEEEGLVGEASDDPTLTDRTVHQSGGTTVTESKHSTQFSSVPGEMTAFGIPEQTMR